MIKRISALHLCGSVGFLVLIVLALLATGCANLQNPFGGGGVHLSDEQAGKVADLINGLQPGGGQAARLFHEKYQDVTGKQDVRPKDDYFGDREISVQLSGTMKVNSTFAGQQFTRADIASLTKIETEVVRAPRVTQVDPDALWSGPVIAPPASTNILDSINTNRLTEAEQELIDSL